MPTIEETRERYVSEHEKETKAQIKKSLYPYVGDRHLISAREFWLFCVGPDRPIAWIRSYKTLLKYIGEDYRHIFKPRVKGVGSGTRYFVKIDNIVDFIYKFDNNEL